MGLRELRLWSELDSSLIPLMEGFKDHHGKRLSIKLKVSELKGIRRHPNSLLKATFWDDRRGCFETIFVPAFGSTSAHTRLPSRSSWQTVYFVNKTRSQRNDKWHKKAATAARENSFSSWPSSRSVRMSLWKLSHIRTMHSFNAKKGFNRSLMGKWGGRVAE